MSAHPNRSSRPSRAATSCCSTLRKLRPGAAAGRGGGGRSERAGHQADPLPDQREQPGRRRAGARGRPRQARDGRRRAQGALRRGAQHRVGHRARARGRAGDLRAQGAQDPRQDLHRRPPRADRHPPLRALRHRQLQREDRAPVQRRQLHDLRRGFRRRRLGVLQHDHRLLPARRATARSRPRRSGCARACWS